jgi:predicted DNA-binding transcriptional regulator AlpA
VRDLCAPVRSHRVSEMFEAPEKALELPRDEAVRVLARIAAVSEVLRIVAARPMPEANGERATEMPDRLITVDEAAQRLGCTAKALYKRAARLPFTRRLGPGTLRFSERGLSAWLAGSLTTRQPNGTVSRRGHGAHRTEART